MHKTEGMHLHVADGTILDLSKERLQRLAHEYWHDPARLPPHIRQDNHFKACEVCPFKGQSVLCSALKPLLPFLEEMEKFHSFDKVTAVYVKKEGLQYISETTMQDALQYVTNLSIFEYCEGAKRYGLYFKGIEPFMDMSECRSRLFLNIYWLSRGNRAEVNNAIALLRQVVTVISKNSVRRLSLICKSDAFINAYVKTHNLMDLLVLADIDAVLEKHFEGTVP